MALPSRLRSLLFAPAVRPDLVAKMPATGADMVAIDLEDATPVDAKAQARADLAGMVEGVVEQIPVSVRVNDPTTPWFADDAASLPDGLSAVVVPKVESRAALDLVAAALAGTNLSIIAGVETARGVADARSLLDHPIVAAAYFGAEDFIADMGGARTASNHEVAHARGSMALAARLAGISLLDQVVVDFRDDERFTRECSEAAAMGYSGKLCIHPAQVALAATAFTPTGDEVDRARRLLKAYDAAVSDGVAAIDFEGQMVDEPVARQARLLLERAD